MGLKPTGKVSGKILIEKIQKFGTSVIIER